MPVANVDPAKLFIFPPSSGCETVIWLLERYGIDTSINSQTAPFFMFAILRAGGKTYPYLDYRGKKLCTSLHISNGLEDLADDAHKLYPQSSPENEKARALWAELNPKLGSAIPRWVYSWLLPHKKLLRGPLTKGVPWWQKFLVAIAYTPIAYTIKKNLGLSDYDPSVDEKTIREIFERVDGLLADGRTFLVADQLSLVDIGVSAMLAPVLLVSKYGHGGLLPDIEAVPAPMQAIVRELEKRPTAKFVERIYNDYR